MKTNNANLKAIIEIVGSNIAKRLKELGMTRKRLAEEVGVSQNSISGYIRGKQLPKFEKLYDISVALKTTISELTGGDAISAQTKNESKKAVLSYQLADAQQILNGVGWLCYKDTDSGEWYLVRQKNIEDVLSLLTDGGAKPKTIRLPDGDITLIALAQTVKDAAIKALDSTKTLEELNNQLDKMSSKD